MAIAVTGLTDLMNSISEYWSRPLSTTYPDNVLATSSGNSLDTARVVSESGQDPRVDLAGAWSINAGTGANEIADALNAPKMVGGSIYNTSSNVSWILIAAGLVAAFLIWKFFK